ncbi:coiled-coil domain-containing protein 174 [Anopheles stephensi]|uniref:CCDC174 alpha/beta GRSR domain-containing protein n=1 Tax=Anopheles stephensi TaxID=30069 RepID=A0A182YHY1_ANOST|nr:coiled-coil domain-containing protein 174 [Anopheles stephensi]
MNDPNRKIEIDKSSLLSLKAELLRKQEEVGRAKASTSIEDFVPKKVSKPEKDVSSSRKDRREKKDKSKPIVTELEDSAQLARSKQMLQAKAKYYDRMVAAGGSLNSDENSLVMFNKKKQDTKPAYNLSDESPRESSVSSSSVSSDSEEDGEGGDNKWVEYTDCLGRTRKCLKEDLKACLARDRELAKTMEPRDGQRREDMQGPSKVNAPPVKESVQSARPEKIINQQEATDEEEDGEIVGPMPPAMGQIGGTDIGERFREMKDQWAEQEEANLEKDSIHYQDVLFDEARLHGVGYYAFSTDQQERNRQRDELDSIRESTLEAQKERETLRKARDKLIADRVKAARARQRARQGLPPEVDDDGERQQSGKDTDQLFESAEEKRTRKAEEKQRKKKEREERRRERERADHVRPWDEGKEQTGEDKEWVPAKERFVLSQHEWNDMKRSERIAEFAPPPAERPFSGRTGTQRPDRHSEPDSDASDSEETVVGPLPPTMTADSGAALEDIPLPEDVEDPARRSLFFTTKKNPPKKELKRRNLNAVEMVTPAAKKPSAPVPIVNELSDTEEPDRGRESAQLLPERRGVEIEPPPTYDYYGPVDGAGGHRRAGGRTIAPENRTNLEASIEAGLKFLRNQSDKSGGPGTKNRWTSNADY